MVYFVANLWMISAFLFGLFGKWASAFERLRCCVCFEVRSLWRWRETYMLNLPGLVSFSLDLFIFFVCFLKAFLKFFSPIPLLSALFLLKLIRTFFYFFSLEFTFFCVCKAWIFSSRDLTFMTSPRKRVEGSWNLSPVYYIDFKQ